MTSQTLSFRRITCQEAWDSPQWPHIQAAYSAAVTYPDLQADPDFEAYRALEAAGVLRCVGAFDGEKLVGFANYILYGLPHFKGKRLASSESLWLDDAYRGRGLGRQLIESMGAFAREDGAYGMYLGAKIGTPGEKALARFAEPMNVLFWRRL